MRLFLPPDKERRSAGRTRSRTERARPRCSWSVALLTYWLGGVIMNRG
jgi:hypothetical protein